MGPVPGLDRSGRGAGGAVRDGACAEADRAPPGEERAERDLSRDWKLRLSARLGGEYFSYEEKLSGAVDTDFSTGAFTSRLWLEGNLQHLSPFLGLQSDVAGGEETSRIVGGNRQQNDLSVVGLLLDVGLGYRIDLNESVTLVPGVGYTLDLVAFERENFEQNGVRVTLVDLDGRPLRRVREDFTGHGVTGRLGLELRPVPLLELQLYGAYTYLPRVTVDNDLGGDVDTDGYLVRGGVTAWFWVLPQLAVGGGAEVMLRYLDKSEVKFASGSMFTASVQFPDSDTLATAVTVGVRTRF